MKLEDFLKDGWARHDSETTEVAKSLEDGVSLVEPTGPDGAAAYMNLVNHAIGDHAKDRARAQRVCEAVYARLTDLGNKAPCLQLAVARRLAGAEALAEEVERELGDDEATRLRVQLFVAQGKAHEGEWDDFGEIYSKCLNVAKGLAAGHAAERAVAIVSNNVATILLELEERDERQDEWLERAALTARTNWIRIGDWMNDERADYLLARVYNSLGRSAKGLEYAQRGLNTIATRGEERVDQAFLELAVAESYKSLDQGEEQGAAIERAKALAAGFEGDGLTSWFEGELAKVL